MPREEKSVKEIHTFLGKEEAEVIPTYESVLTLANHIQYLPIEQRDNGGWNCYLLYAIPNR